MTTHTEWLLRLESAALDYAAACVSDPEPLDMCGMPADVQRAHRLRERLLQVAFEKRRVPNDNRD
jgi:hypothetical protein